jgi:cyclophilin family peptidyl-prolyl cis-trans isomerase
MPTSPRFPSRFRRLPRPAAPRRGPAAAIESVEPRLMFHVSAPVVPLPDLSRPVGTTQDTIDLTESFADPSDSATRVAFGLDSGRVLVELFDAAAPFTVANFLNYMRSDRYDDTVVHRSAQLGAPTFAPFVIQGGGFRASDLVHIVTDPAVRNEFRPNTQQRGTLSMAKQGNNPNSATSEWFFNLRDNKDILDTQNGGFTSFGQVLGNGMAVVDAIAALPTITQQAPSPFNSLTDFPVENNPPTPPRDYVNVDYIAELPKLTGQVTSSNPGLVTPTIAGKTIVLNYTPGATGKATITINASDRLGGLVQETFDVRVGFTDIALGEGTTARTVTYTDPDGTVGTITVNGGSATVSFAGTGIVQTPAGRNITLAGTAVEADQITATGGSPAINVRGRGGDQRLVVRGINGGAVRSFAGREVILQGTSNIAGGIGRLDLFRTEDATITLGAPADARLQPVITLGSAEDTDITSAATIKNIRFGSWASGDAESDAISAPAIGKLQSDGDFTGVLTLNGPGTGTNLGNSRVKGAATGTWSVQGTVGNISVGSTAASWLGSFGGPIGALAVAGDLAGTLNAASVRSLRAGSLTGANITLIQPTAAGAIALGSLNSRGAIANSNIRAVGADVGSVSALSITNSTIYAGVNPAEGAALPDAATDFVAAATIRSVTVRNRTAASFVNSDIAAQTLGRMNLGVINTANGGVPFGLAGDTILSVTATDAAGARIRFARLTEAGDSRESADFKVRVF